jgi:hypothetical protein
MDSKTDEIFPDFKAAVAARLARERMIEELILAVNPNEDRLPAPERGAFRVIRRMFGLNGEASPAHEEKLRGMVARFQPA